jgi:asparagine synthase (glutamine-hydrolysing)
VPFSYKLQGARGKVLLRDTFADYIPPVLATAPKRGFNAPLAQWMRATLDRYFDPSRNPDELHRDGPRADGGSEWRSGVLDLKYVDFLRSQFRSGKRDNSYELFAVIMFDIWWRTYVEKAGTDLAAV